MVPTFSPANAQIAEELSDYDMMLFNNGFGPSLMRAEIEAGFCLLVRVSGQIAGYALTRSQGPIVDITRLAVLERYRRKGLGRALLQAVLAHHKASQVMLHVKRDNREALELYKSEGFQIRGAREQSWLMVRMGES